MLRLLLFRHAKANAGVPDEKRELAPRGRRAASKMGKLLASRGLAPHLALCSMATRARQTLEGAAPSWTPQPAIRFLPELYAASGYLDIIRAEGAAAERLLLVGHNPALEQTALSLVRPGDGDALAQMNEKFPTAAIAVIEFVADAWPDIEPATGTLLDFLTPAQAGEPGD